MNALVRLLMRIGLGAVVLVGLLAVAGATYQALASAADRRNHPASGQMVDVGGYDLYVRTMGEGHTGPTVILENGGSGIAPQWGWVQPAIAEFAPVVAYDRPGTGRSEPPPQPLDADDAARALHTALEALDIEGPYVLVGHSMGGLMVRVFHTLYPDEVAGLVLVDPRDVTFEGVFTEAEAEPPVALYRLLHGLSYFGFTRLTGLVANQAQGLPPESYAQAVAVGSTSQYAGGLVREMRYGDTATDFLAGRNDLRDVPVIVLSAGAPDESFDATRRPAFTALHAELAAQSNQGEHRVIPGAGHLTIMTHAEHAMAVIDAVRDMLARLTA